MNLIYRRIHCIFIVMMTFSIPVLAESNLSPDSRFIIDRLYVTVRAEPNESSSVVISGLPSGTQLTLLQEDKSTGYSQVITPTNQKGWIKTRYLQKDQTAASKVSSLEKQLANTLGKDKGGLQKELQSSEEKLSDANIRISKMEKELSEIKYASENIVKISTQNRELTEKNQLLQSRIDSLEAIKDQKNDDDSMILLIYGGLLVLGTLIVNMIIDGIKRKRSYGSGGW